MSNSMIETIKTVRQSQACQDRLSLAVEAAGDYAQRRATEQAASSAAAQMAAEILGATLPESKQSGLCTLRGLERLRKSAKPIDEILSAVMRMDTGAKTDLYWALDAARRAAAIQAVKAAHAVSTATESAKMAAQMLGDGSEPYASGDTGSELYTESGHAAQVAFEDDTAIWYILAVMLSTDGMPPLMARFWVMGDDGKFAPINCDAFADIESFLAERNI